MKDIIKNIFNKIRYIKSEIEHRNKIEKINRNLRIKNTIDRLSLSKHLAYWSQLKKKVNPKWFLVYSYISGIPDYLYVPENIYYNIIEEKLNDRELSFSYKDKNFYEQFYSENIFPNCILRNINGSFYDKNYNHLKVNDKNIFEYLHEYGKIIIKPSIESGGGKNIELFIKSNHDFVNSNNQILSINYLKQNYNKNYILQEYITQNSFFLELNPTSVNTVRIFTYRSVLSDEIIVLQTILRVGRKGSIVDNQAMGGISCKINEDGFLNSYAIDKYGNKFFEINGKPLNNYERVPKVEEMKFIAKQIAKKNLYSRLMGFDFCLNSNNEIKLVEINNQYAEINFFQMNSNSLFGKYTDEIVNYCKKT